MSFIGSRLRTRGMTSKLFGGGGDCGNHSSVLPFQGSLPALRPCLMLQSRVGDHHHAGDATDRELGEEAGGDSSGVLKMIEPRQRVAIQLKILMPVGTAIVNEDFRLLCLTGAAIR
jgi:hypothetical protein